MKKVTLKNKETGNSVMLPIFLLDEILAKIADYEETIDDEWGDCRSAEQLINEGRMPEIYNKLLALKNGKQY